MQLDLDKRYFGEYIPPEQCECDCGGRYIGQSALRHFDFCATKTGGFKAHHSRFLKEFLHVLSDDLTMSATVWAEGFCEHLIYRICFDEGILKAIAFEAFQRPYVTAYTMRKPPGHPVDTLANIACVFKKKALFDSKELDIHSHHLAVNFLVLSITSDSVMFKPQKHILHSNNEERLSRSIYHFYYEEFAESINKKVIQGKYQNLGEAYQYIFGIQPLGLKQNELHHLKICTMIEDAIADPLSKTLNNIATSYFKQYPQK